jgi:hypothetical protein
MGQKIGSIIWDLMILAGFVYLLLVMRGKVQPAQPIPFIQKASLPVKIIIYLGVAVFGAAVILELI